MNKRLPRNIFILAAAIMLMFASLPVYAQEQKATVQYVELWRLSKGEAGILSEFNAGLEANKNKLTATGEYYNGGEVFRYNDKEKENMMLFFETRSGENRLFSGMSAKSGDFFGIRIGTDSLEKIADFLGAPDVFEEVTDMTDLPMAVYYFTEGTLLLNADKKHVITEARYGVADNAKRLAILDALMPSVYKNAEPLNAPLLRELSATGIIPPKAWYDFKWPVSREGIAYICVSLYEFLTKEALQEANPSPYADVVSCYALKATTLGIFNNLPGEKGLLKPNVKPNRTEICNMLNITLKAANVDYAVTSSLDPKDLVSYEEALVMVHKALKSGAAYKHTVAKTVRVYCPNNDSSKLVSMNIEIMMSPSLRCNDQLDYKALESALKQTGGETSRNVLQKETLINGIRLNKEADILYIDISGDILKYNLGTSAEGLMLNSIASTFMEFYGVNHIMLTVDGGPYESGHGTFEPGDTLNNAG